MNDDQRWQTKTNDGERWRKVVRRSHFQVTNGQNSNLKLFKFRMLLIIKKFKSKSEVSKIRSRGL